jgi:hypothetical protein
MGTATSRAALGALAALGLAACGAPAGAVRPFAWLSPRAAPSAWPVATISSGAAMPYPPSWQRTRGDRGTATAVRLDQRGHIVGYLNLTPQQGTESAANGRTFRTEHNADEGDRHVRTLATAGGLRFRSGSGACVKDSYTTGTGARYVELACLVRGSVIVGAAPPQAWPGIAPLIERAISGLSA